MAISNTTESVTVRTKKEITEVRIARNPDNTIYWSCPVVTTISNDGTSEEYGQTAESLVVQHPAMQARITGLNAILQDILDALEAEYISLNP